jgi:hypothetical protein
VNDWIQICLLAVQFLTLVALVVYAWDTRRIRKAAEGQVEASNKLLEAAIDQSEGLSKPCLTLCGELRADADTILEMHGAIGRTTARSDQGHLVVQNIGNGIALNVRYSIQPLPPSDREYRLESSGYLQNALAGQRISMAELVTTTLSGDYEIGFQFQSIGGREYRTVVKMNERVLTGFTFAQVRPRTTS